MHHVEPGIGEPFVEVMGPPGTRSILRIESKPSQDAFATTGRWSFLASGLVISIDGRPFREAKDPQGILDRTTSTERLVSGTIKGTLGPHTLFVPAGDAAGFRMGAHGCGNSPSGGDPEPRTGSQLRRMHFCPAKQHRDGNKGKGPSPLGRQDNASGLSIFLRMQSKSSRQKAM